MMCDRIKIIIPDLHGDFIQFKNILSYFQIIDKTEDLESLLLSPSYVFKSKINMQGKQIIQLGDILDSKSRVKNGQECNYSDMLLFIFLVRLKENFKNDVVLIIGNHEYMNCHGIYHYANCHSLNRNNLRNKIQHRFIKLSLLKHFQYHYIDENQNLYIHAALPTDLNLKDANSLLINSIVNGKNIYNTDEQFIDIYKTLFSRNMPTTSELDGHNVNYIFMGHTPVRYIKPINDRIFYLDNCISRSFNSENDFFYIVTLQQNKYHIHTISRNT